MRRKGSEAILNHPTERALLSRMSVTFRFSVCGKGTHWSSVQQAAEVPKVEWAADGCNVPTSLARPTSPPGLCDFMIHSSENI